MNQQFLYINFSINNMKGMFLPHCWPLAWSSREREGFIFKAFSLHIRVWKQSEGERERNNNMILNMSLNRGVRYEILHDLAPPSICTVQRHIHSVLTQRWSYSHGTLHLFAITKMHYLHVLKPFRINVSFTCAFSKPVHLKSTHEKACLTAPDNWTKLYFVLILLKHTRFMYRLSWLCLKWK